jgi:hypothetical protein
VDIVICGDKQRLPGSRHEDLLEEDLGHVEGGDNGGQAGKLEQKVEILAYTAAAATFLGVNRVKVGE